MGQLSDFVKKQFGECFKVTPVRAHSVKAQKEASPPVVVLLADLDGDGVEDIVIIARCGKPLAGETDFGYRVSDPYDGYFGYSDPRVTQTFNAHDPENDHLLLIVHGWKLPQPKGKFVIINTPFDHLELTSVTLKRKQKRTAVLATESGVMESTLYWDGKKYRYEPGTGEPEE